MPQKKFQQLFRFFHLNNNSKQVPYGQTGHDKLFKVRKLLDLLSPLFESEFEMHQSGTIDEAMIPFKGRLRFKQYMKDKPTKWGIKIFILADASTGYGVIPFKISHFQPPSHIDHLGLCSKNYYRLLWIPNERILSYSVQLKLIWKLRPFKIRVPRPLSDNSVKQWRL